MYEHLLLDKHVLVLEDQLLIAMEVEFSLLEMGAKSVALATNVREALQLIEEASPDIAVLDINLGPSLTSFPVAEVLRTLGTPWIFATGYGDEIKLPPRLKSAAVVRKPYSTEMLGRALHETLIGVR